MEKILSDYLHHHLGCEVMTPEGRGKLVRIDIEVGWCVVVFGTMGPDFEATYFFHSVKPILRPLSSMTEEEAAEHDKIYASFRGCDWQTNQKRNAAIAYWLLSKQFDIFSLIENGMAIDATTL